MAIGPAAVAVEMAADEDIAAAMAPPVPQRTWPSSGAAYWALSVIVLATFLTFLDQVMFGMLAQRIKVDFGLTDAQLGFLAGPASILCYLFVGIPLARLADIYPRKYVLAGGVTIVGLITALSGIAQNFTQFIATRAFLAAGGSAHGPSSYSLLADAFPPRTLTRAFALLQFGFIGGTTLGPIIGGTLIGVTAHWAPTYFGGLRILGWQWIMIWTGLPGLLVALLFLTIREPARFAPGGHDVAIDRHLPFGRRVLAFTGLDAARAIHARRQVYYPMFAGLALSAIQVFGLQFWQVPFLIRTYGWTEQKIGAVMSATLLVGSLTGLLLGGVFVEWLARRHKDANVRAAAILFACVTVTAIATPLMPNGYLALACGGLAAMFGIAGAVPQNAAIQRVAPNAMRGQVTAIYLFMFTFFGQMGSFTVGLVQDYVVGVERDLWKALLLTSVVLLPIATVLIARAMRPYREEVARLEAEGR